MRNCTRDEGRSFEVGNQVLISSHRKLLSSKAMVVNVAEKSEHDSGTFRTRAWLSFAPPTCRMPLGQSQALTSPYITSSLIYVSANVGSRRIPARTRVNCRRYF
jgi:hypothetical protein